MTPLRQNPAQLADEGVGLSVVEREQNQGKAFGMKMKIVLLALILCLSPNALTALDTGLEMGGSRAICLVVEDVGRHAFNIGYSVEFIRSEIESHLIQNGMHVSRDCEQDGYLYGNLYVLKDAYAFRIQFNRTFTYNVGSRTFSALGSAWGINGMGHHGGVGDFVVGHILDKLDLFIAGCMKANNL